MHNLLLCQVDRPSVTEQQCNEVHSNLFDLFAHLGATDDQLDFTTLYASAREVHIIHCQLHTIPLEGLLHLCCGFLIGFTILARLFNVSRCLPAACTPVE